MSEDHDKQMNTMESSHSNQLKKMQEVQEQTAFDASERIHKTHQRVQDAHESFFMVKREFRVNLTTVKDPSNMKQDMRI